MKLSAPIYRLKRRARMLARDSKLPLHAALDRISREEGFQGWSHLTAAIARHHPAGEILGKLGPGDLVLLGARPGQGKTLLGLELTRLALAAGRPAYFFTLEDSEQIVTERLHALGANASPLGARLSIDASDFICATHIIEKVGDTRGAMIVIDYLQLLDQQRRLPDLASQIGTLKAFAGKTGAIVVALSQIDRRFDASGRSLPTRSDVRLPNPLDLALFSKACFIHQGVARFDGPG